MLQIGIKGTRSEHAPVCILDIFLLLLLGVEFLFVANFFLIHVWLFFVPTYYTDIFVDLSIVDRVQSLRDYITEYHNEHRIIATKILSLIDFTFFDQRYVVHRAVSIVSLLVTCAWLSGVLRQKEYLQTFTNAAFAVVFIFAPTMVAVVAFPYFVNHFIGSLFAVSVVVSANRALRAIGTRDRLLSYFCTIVFGICALASNSNAELLVASAVASPFLFGRKITWLSLACAICIFFPLTIVWRMAFLSPAGHELVAKIKDPSAWSGVVDYAWRVFSLPAFFAGLRGFPLVCFTAVNILLTAAACLSPVWARRETVAFHGEVWATLVGHALTIVLIALGRSGGAYDAEDPKYFYYTAIVAACSAVLLTSSLHEQRTRTIVTTVYMVFGLFAIWGGGASSIASEVFYRNIDASALGAAVDLKDPKITAVIPEGIDRGLVDLARNAKANIFGTPPASLLGSRLYPDALSAHRCRGSVDEVVPVQASRGAGFRIVGWALQPSSGLQMNLGLVALDESGEVVGAGIFVAPRPDVARYVEENQLMSTLANSDKRVDGEALTGFSLYVRPNDRGKLRLLTVGLSPNSYPSCQFAELAPPAMGATDYGENDAFLSAYAQRRTSSWSERLSSILAWAKEVRTP